MYQNRREQRCLQIDVAETKQFYINSFLQLNTRKIKRINYLFQLFQ